MLPDTYNTETVKRPTKDSKQLSRLRIFLIVYVFVALITVIITMRFATSYVSPMLYPDLKTVPVNDMCVKGCPDQAIYEDMQFENFIWIIADALSYRKAQPVRDVLQKHGKMFKLMNTAGMLSQAIAKAWITGRSNPYLPVLKCTGDHIFGAINRGRKNLTISSFGSSNIFFPTPFREIEEQDRVFKYVSRVDDFDLNCEHSACKWFNKPEYIEEFKKNLTYWYEHNESVFYWSGLTDKAMHLQSGRFEWKYPILDEMAAVFAKDLEMLRDWIDTHPKTLLIISADHGYDEPGRIHGGLIPNNNGWHIYYNPIFTPETRVMNTTDVAPTIASYIKRTDIPANSVGQARPAYENLADEASAWQRSVLQKERQFNLTFPWRAERLPITRQFLSFDKSSLPRNITFTELKEIADGVREDGYKGISELDAINAVNTWIEYDKLYNKTSQTLWVKLDERANSQSRMKDKYSRVFFILRYLAPLLTSAAVLSIVNPYLKAKIEKKSRYKLTLALISTGTYLISEAFLTQRLHMLPYTHTREKLYMWYLRSEALSNMETHLQHWTSLLLFALWALCTTSEFLPLIKKENVRNTQTYIRVFVRAANNRMSYHYLMYLIFSRGMHVNLKNALLRANAKEPKLEIGWNSDQTHRLITSVFVVYVFVHVIISFYKGNASVKNRENRIYMLYRLGLITQVGLFLLFTDSTVPSGLKARQKDMVGPYIQYIGSLHPVAIIFTAVTIVTFALSVLIMLNYKPVVGHAGGSFSEVWAEHRELLKYFTPFYTEILFFSIFIMCLVAQKCVVLTMVVIKLLMCDFGILRELAGLLTSTETKTLPETLTQLISLVLFGVVSLGLMVNNFSSVYVSNIEIGPTGNGETHWPGIFSYEKLVVLSGIIIGLPQIMFVHMSLLVRVFYHPVYKLLRKKMNIAKYLYLRYYGIVHITIIAITYFLHATRHSLGESEGMPMDTIAIFFPSALLAYQALTSLV